MANTYHHKFQSQPIITGLDIYVRLF